MGWINEQTAESRDRKNNDSKFKRETKFLPVEIVKADVIRPSQNKCLVSVT